MMNIYIEKAYSNIKLRGKKIIYLALLLCCNNILMQKKRGNFLKSKKIKMTQPLKSRPKHLMLTLKWRIVYPEVGHLEKSENVGTF